MYTHTDTHIYIYIYISHYILSKDCYSTKYISFYHFVFIIIIYFETIKIIPFFTNNLIKYDLILLELDINAIILLLVQLCLRKVLGRQLSCRV